jgi:hypothetical protein
MLHLAGTAVATDGDGRDFLSKRRPGNIDALHGQGYGLFNA